MPPPKMPTIIGSTTVSVNSAATVASIALPPAAMHFDGRGRCERMVRDRHAARCAVTGVFSHSKTVPA